ncbi:MAG: DNA polymerase III subunit delta [Terriglobales bacterium]
MASERLQPLYAVVGDETRQRDTFRARLRMALGPDGLEWGWNDEDLGQSDLEEILDRARTPSLMVGQQVFWVRQAKELFGRGARDVAAPLQRYLQAAPAATVALIADHIHIPAERQRIGLEDKAKLQRIEEVLGPLCEMVWCAAVSEVEASRLAQAMARELGHSLGPAQAVRLAESQGGNLALIERELEKLGAFAGADAAIDDAAIAALVPGARSSNGYDLAASLARGDRGGSLSCLQRLWAEEGDGGAIGLLFQLSRAFSMALILRQHGVRDRTSLYRVLPDGLRPPSFAADAVLGLSRQMAEVRLRQGLALWAQADVELRSSPLSARLVFERAVLALTGGA